MHYHSFVLTLWRETDGLPNAPPVWRYALENPHTGERIGFRDAAELTRFLNQWVALLPLDGMERRTFNKRQPMLSAQQGEPMNTQSIIRLGGIAAIVCAVLYVASIGLWMGAGTESSPPLATAAYMASQAIFFVTLCALYLIHRDEAPALTLVGVLVLGISIAASFFVDPTDMNNPVVLYLTIAYGAGGLILGWLAYRSPRLSKGIGVAALLTGAFSLIMVPFMLTGSAELVGLLNLLVSGDSTACVTPKTI
jgi:hypothetical protein